MGRLPAFILLPRVGVHLCMSGLRLLCLDESPLFFVIARTRRKEKTVYARFSAKCGLCCWPFQGPQPKSDHLCSSVLNRLFCGRQHDWPDLCGAIQYDLRYYQQLSLRTACGLESAERHGGNAGAYYDSLPR